MKAFDYDDKKFVRRIKKYRECRLNKRVLQSNWAVVGKITIKIKTIGISSIEKKNKKNNAKEAPEENNEGIDIMKHEVDEAAGRKDVAGGDDVTGGMEVVEAGDAEGNAVKDLLKGESNVSEQEDKPTTDDTEILDKGGGRKEKTV